MGYVLPQFNLLARVWYVPRRFSSGAPDAVDVPCQLYVYSRPLMDVQYGEKTLWVPPVTLRLPKEKVGTWAQMGLVECPSGSERYYLTRWKEWMHLGFPNEYLIAMVDQCTAEGDPVARYVTYPLPAAPTTSSTTSSTTSGPTTTVGPTTTPGPTTTAGPTTSTTTAGPTTTSTSTTTAAPSGLSCSSAIPLASGYGIYSVSVPPSGARWYDWTSPMIGTNDVFTPSSSADMEAYTSCGGTLISSSVAMPLSFAGQSAKVKVSNFGGITITSLTVSHT